MTTEQKHRPKVLVRGAGLPWGFVLAVPLAVALIVFVAQNTQQVTVHWTVWKVESSLAVVVLVTILAAVLLAELVGLVWRHRRRRLLSRQESLQAAVAVQAVGAETPPEPEGGTPAEPREAVGGIGLEAEGDTAPAGGDPARSKSADRG